jgi:predicted nucleic acid-binding protein
MLWPPILWRLWKLYRSKETGKIVAEEVVMELARRGAEQDVEYRSFLARNLALRAVTWRDATKLSVDHVTGRYGCSILSMRTTVCCGW